MNWCMWTHWHTCTHTHVRDTLTYLYQETKTSGDQDKFECGKCSLKCTTAGLLWNNLKPDTDILAQCIRVTHSFLLLLLLFCMQKSKRSFDKADKCSILRHPFDNTQKKTIGDCNTHLFSWDIPIFEWVLFIETRSRFLIECLLKLSSEIITRVLISHNYGHQLRYRWIHELIEFTAETMLLLY